MQVEQELVVLVEAAGIQGSGDERIGNMRVYHEEQSEPAKQVQECKPI